MFLESRNESVFIDHISEEDHLTRSSRSSDHFIQEELKSAVNLLSAWARLNSIYIIKDQEIRSEFSITCRVVLPSRRSSERHRPDIALVFRDEFVCPLDFLLTFSASAFWVVKVSEIIHEPLPSLSISDQGVRNIGQVFFCTIYRLTVSHNVPTPLVCDAVVDIHLSNRCLGWSSESLDEDILALLKCSIDLLECWRSRKAEVFPEVVVAILIESRLKERSPEDFVLHSLQKQFSINQLLHPHHQLKVKKQAKLDQLQKEATPHFRSCSWSEWYCKAQAVQPWPFSAIPWEQSHFILRFWSSSSLLWLLASFPRSAPFSFRSIYFLELQEPWFSLFQTSQELFSHALQCGGLSSLSINKCWGWLCRFHLRISAWFALQALVCRSRGIPFWVLFGCIFALPFYSFGQCKE
uniref:Uncharacterized protein n=1 Tax=Caudovirales sp. gcode 4 TaxID=2838363 RepID=A0A8S5RT64_9CAUD|nr:MAG TPA: hypothetical protein [Caudovirales sp. gcode 4]